MQQEQLKTFIKEKIEDLKGRDLIELDVTGKSTITDTLLICSGNSKRHVASIADNIVISAKQEGIQPLNVEGQDTGEWVLVDFGEIIVHVMQDDTRDFYQLEKLWS
ncbi:ribosome silencing factor [Alteromonadaceae bacterium M269]|nr:ribosome silencing factor [Alteromonadaceae bacterium M269]